MTGSRFAVFLLLLAWTTASGAASLTLDQAVSLALERSTEVQRLTTQVSLDEATTRQTEAWRRPNLNLSLSGSEQLSRVTALDGSVEGQATHGVSLRASSSLSLFDGFASQAAVQSSRLELRAAGQDLTQARQRVALATASNFLAVLSAEGLIGVAQESIAAQQDQLEQLRAGQEQGTRSRAEVLQQMASLASARMGLVSAEQVQALALLRLKDDLRLDLGEELTLTGPTPGALVGTPSTYDTDEVSRQALAGRPEIDGQRLRVQAAEEQIRQARAGLLPDLSLSVNGGTGYSGQEGAPSVVDQLFDRNPSATVGLSLALPLFDRGQTSTAVTRARLQVRNEQLTLE
ncbi:MAG: TolC family protein, partial [Candidatus Latescibacterota bacterium]